MKKYVIIGFVVVLVIGLAILGIYLKKDKTIYNNYHVNGSTTGNLYNGGLFCENNGVVYFANLLDDGKLYSMDASGSNVKKINDDSVKYINVDDNYIYYVRDNTNKDSQYYFSAYNNNSLCRLSKKGHKLKILDEDPCIYASLIGNYIYYLHYDKSDATTLYKVCIDGTDRKQLKTNYVFTCSSSDQYFYFNGPKDGKMYRYDTDSDTEEVALDCNCYKPIVDGDNAYYLDVDHNNALVHTSLSTQKPVTLTKDFIELYNVYGSYIYYQRGGDNPALCMIKNDGSVYKEIAMGEYTNINVTSYYIYFQDFRTGAVYYTSTSNPGDIQSFSPDIDD